MGVATATVILRMMDGGRGTGEIGMQEVGEGPTEEAEEVRTNSLFFYVNILNIGIIINAIDKYEK